MTDDLNHLKSLMDDATPQPDPTQRAADIRLAQNNFAALQKMHATADVKASNGLWTRMKSLLQGAPSKGIATASVAVIAGGLLMVAPPNTDPQRAPDTPALSAIKI